MQAVQNFLSQFGAFSNLAADPRVQALIVVVLSLVVAKIADWIMSRLITRWARKTTTDLDDRIVEVLHRPLFLFVLLAGLSVAVDLLSLQGVIQRVTFGALGTMAVFIGFGLASRLSGLALEALSQQADRFRFVDEQTLPLFRNLSNVLLLGWALTSCSWFGTWTLLGG